MRSPFGNSEIVTREIGGHYQPDRDTCVPPLKFARVARLLWPNKTAAHLAGIAGQSDRMAKRWLSGEYEPPASVLAAVIVEICKRE